MRESGVSFYIKAYLDTPICFPNGEVCCWHCLFFNKHTEECRVTNETIVKPKRFVGGRCPLREEEPNGKDS